MSKEALIYKVLYLLFLSDNKYILICTPGVHCILFQTRFLQSFIYRSFFIVPTLFAMSGSGSSAAASAASERTVKEVYSCSACHVSFTDRQTQRAHMKDDWQ